MLPITVCVKLMDIEDWEEMDKWDKEEAVSDFLSHEFGFCHKGFEYEEVDGKIFITNIIWDEEE